jgi:hypothetical protein
MGYVLASVWLLLVPMVLINRFGSLFLAGIAYAFFLAASIGLVLAVTSILG